MFWKLPTVCFWGGVLAGYMRGWGEIQGAVRYPASGWLGVCGGSRSYRYVCVYIYIMHVHRLDKTRQQKVLKKNTLIKNLEFHKRDVLF